MRFIFLTSYKYPSARPVGDNFGNTNVISINSWASLRSVFYFFYLPYFILAKKYNTKETVLFSNDPYLSVTLIFWRKVLRFRFNHKKNKRLNRSCIWY